MSERAKELLFEATITSGGMLPVAILARPGGPRFAGAAGRRRRCIHPKIEPALQVADRAPKTGEGGPSPERRSFARVDVDVRKYSAAGECGACRADWPISFPFSAPLRARLPSTIMVNEAPRVAREVRWVG
jgi:hypothetical protein